MTPGFGRWSANRSHLSRNLGLRLRCWALSVPHLRLGYGKPLGFGSVRVNIDQASSEVWTGGDNAAPGGRWMSLQPGPTDPPAVINAATEAFKVAANADSLKRLRRILSGDPRLRVHYPRVATGATGTPPPPTPEGKNYEWFVNDEKADGGAQPMPPGMAEGTIERSARRTAVPARRTAVLLKANTTATGTRLLRRDALSDHSGAQPRFVAVNPGPTTLS